MPLQMHVGNLSLGPGQGLAGGKPGRCGCATGPEAGVVVDEDAGRDVRQYNTLHGIHQGQSPLGGIPLSYH